MSIRYFCSVASLITAYCSLFIFFYRFRGKVMQLNVSIEIKWNETNGYLNLLRCKIIIILNRNNAFACSFAIADIGFSIIVLYRAIGINMGRYQSWKKISCFRLLLRNRIKFTHHINSFSSCYLLCFLFFYL